MECDLNLPWLGIRLAACTFGSEKCVGGKDKPLALSQTPRTEI